MYKRTPKVENISDYATADVLAHLVKPRAGRSVKFVTDDPMHWFIDKLCYKTKTGVVTLNEGINADSYEYWVEFYENKGFVKV